MGQCPVCGDVVYYYKSRSSRGRYARCRNPDCQFFAPLPRRGNLLDTDCCCEKYQGVLVGVETFPTDNVADARRYFWVAGNSPRTCEQCRYYSSCTVVREAAELLDDGGAPWVDA
ncbi:MAG: hypothetical protein Kow0069_34060 [Promethearchaeota archaeon]